MNPFVYNMPIGEKKMLQTFSKREAVQSGHIIQMAALEDIKITSSINLYKIHIVTSKLYDKVTRII